MDPLDGDALRVYLNETITTFEAMAGRMEPGTNGNDRVDGALLALKQVRSEIVTGRFSPQRTPMGEITVPTRSKVRKYDPQTSFDAAVGQTPEKTRLLYNAIWILLSRAPLTDDEIQGALSRSRIPYSPSGVRTRRRELVDAGWVMATEEKRESANGSPSTVWAIRA